MDFNAFGDSLRVQFILLFIVGVICAWIAGPPIWKFVHSDSVEEIEQASYCRNVHAGVWPDFHKAYAVECAATHGPMPKKINP